MKNINLFSSFIKFLFVENKINNNKISLVSDGKGTTICDLLKEIKSYK